jgi:hypothetical protein
MLTIGVASSEPLDAAGVNLDNGGLALGSPSVSGTNHTWTYTVKGSDNAGFNLSATAKDAAGNETSVAATGSVTLDGVVPVMTNVKADKAKYSRVGGYDRVTVTFDSSEDVGAGLSVKAGGQAMACDAYSATPPNYTCRYDIQAGDTAGIKDINIQAADAAGNTGFGSGSVEYDFGNPALVSAAPSQGYYKGGQTIAYTVSVSEPLLGAPGRPTVRVHKDSVEQPGYFGAPSSETDTSFTYTKAVTADGTYTVTIDLTDKAGNAVVNVGSPVGWTIDAAAPVVNQVSLATNNPNFNTLARDGEVVSAVFTISEDPPANPTVTIGGAPMNFVSKTGGGPYTFTYDRTAASGDGDGVKGVGVTAMDTAGNVTVFSFGSTVTYDFTAPEVTANSENIQLIPFPGCLLSNVTKVAMNTTARVSFTATEALLGDPVVTISPSEGTWDISKHSNAGLSYTYDTRPTGGGPVQGTVQVRVAMTDRAGNTAAPIALNLPAPGIEVDTVPPAPITSAQNDGILYRRIPWGSDATGGLRYYSVKTLDGQADVVEPDAHVIFWDAADTATAGEIGRTKADASGYFPEKELNRADRAHVYLSQVDEAGNLDSATAPEIKNHDWTATMGYKVPGSTFENPHRFELRRDFLGSLFQKDFVEAGAGDGLEKTGPPFAVSQGRGSWAAMSSVRPPGRFAHAMAYDSARGKAVFFGGCDLMDGTGACIHFSDETWEWDGASWTQHMPPERPSTRAQHAMVYDSARGKVILFGGIGSGGSETWAWDGTSWIKLSPTDRPSARSRHGMAYDSGRGKVVLFGGYDGAYDDETWEWDGINWTKLSPADKPSARDYHAMAYDAAREKVVLFGGEAGALDDETWEWDGTNWTKLSPANKPSSRGGHTLAYDIVRRKVVLFGGMDGLFDDETWEWDGVNWVQCAPSAKPTGRTQYGMAFDSIRAKTVLFGGYDGALDDETWEWDGDAWTRRTLVNKPSARETHGLAYDEARGNVILFGGDNGSTRNDETWVFDGNDWTQLAPAGKPSARNTTAMVYDGSRGKILLFGGADAGGRNDETWEWDGSTWTLRAPATKPAARNFHAMAFDSARGKVVLFGGVDTTYDDETWEWDGGNWIEMIPANRPIARYAHAMAFDAARGKTVLFGGHNGFTSNDETWEWDGTDWTQRMPANKPSPRYGHAMAYDGARARVVLSSGYFNQIGSETWEWDGDEWTRLESENTPPKCWYHSLAYDSGRKKVVMFGGTSGTLLNETWEWDGGAGSRPAGVMSASFLQAGLPAGAKTREVSTSFFSGGVGYPGSATTNGAELMIWDEGQWKTVATNGSPPSIPSLAQWSTRTDPYWGTLGPAEFSERVGRLFFGDQQSLNFAVTPSAPNGTGTGEIGVDYAEVVVRYRMP